MMNQVKVNVGRNSQGFIVMDVYGTQRLDAREAERTFKVALERAQQAISRNERYVEVEMSMRVEFGHPHRAEQIADDLLTHANDDELNDRSYGEEARIAQAEFLREEEMMREAFPMDEGMA